MILALDPATNCGFALGDKSGIVASGTWNLAARRDESKGMRLVRLRSKLDEIWMSESRQDSGLIVIFESARMASARLQVSALIIQSELQGVIKLWCETRGVEYAGRSSSEIKKRATGKGNAGKPLVLAAAQVKWPERAIADDNEADALWLLDLALSEGLIAELTKGGP